MCNSGKISNLNNEEKDKTLGQTKNVMTEVTTSKTVPCSEIMPVPHPEIILGKPEIKLIPYHESKLVHNSEPKLAQHPQKKILLVIHPVIKQQTKKKMIMVLI